MKIEPNEQEGKLLILWASDLKAGVKQNYKGPKIS